GPHVAQRFAACIWHGRTCRRSGAWGVGPFSSEDRLRDDDIQVLTVGVSSWYVRSSFAPTSFHQPPVISLLGWERLLLINGRHDSATWTYAVCKHVAPER